MPAALSSMRRTFGAHGEFGKRIGMSKRALRRCVVLLGAIGKMDLVNQVWSAYYTQMKSVSDQRWQPSKEIQADIWDVKANLNDQPPHQTMGRSELEKRLLAQVCEQCGATSLTTPIEVHHIRALKDLEKYPGRKKPRWVKIMAARRRKTLILCRTCHQDVQYGRPMRRQKSSS